MATKKEVNELRICVGMTGLPLSNFVAELILETQKKMNEMGGDFDLHTACKIHSKVEEKYKK